MSNVEIKYELIKEFFGKVTTPKTLAEVCRFTRTPSPIALRTLRHMCDKGELVRDLVDGNDRHYTYRRIDVNIRRINRHEYRGDDRGS